MTVGWVICILSGVRMVASLRAKAVSVTIAGGMVIV
jgi:hypothetical protein